MRSAPLLLPGVCCVLGVFLHPWWLPGAERLIVGAVLLFLLAALSGRRAAIWAGCLVLGSAAPAFQDPAPQLRGRVQLEGQVLQAMGSRSVLELSRVQGESASGRVLLRSDPLQVGDAVAVFGRAVAAEDPVLPGAFDEELVARSRRIRTLVLAEDLARSGEQRRPFVGLRHEGLLEATTSADRRRVDPESRDLLRATGTSHLLAISGLHLGLLAGGVTLLTGLLVRPLVLPVARLSSQRQLVLIALVRALPVVFGVGVALAFGTLASWPVSTRRAAWMVAGALTGKAAGRGVPALNLLGAAAGIVALGDPGSVRGLSFGLSFGAVVGLLCVGPRLARLVPPDLSLPTQWLLKSLIATCAASAGTLPLSAWVFQDLPLVSPLANVVAVPLVGWVAVPAALLGQAGMPGAAGVADGAWELTLGWLGWLPQSVVHPAVGPVGAAALLLAVVLSRRSLRVGLVIGAVALLWRPRPDVLTLSFLDVGQGDAALLEFPDGRVALVDGGPPGRDVLHYLRRRGIRRLDEVMLSHPHPDHFGGVIPVLESLEVDQLRVSRRPRDPQDPMFAIWQLAWSRGVEVVGPDAPTLTGRILHPTARFAAEHDDDNELSLVWWIRVGTRDVLLTGDIEDAAEAALAPILGPVALLKVPHHGSTTSSSPALLDALQPQLAVVSAGRDNRYRHPRPEVVARYQRLLRTDQRGTVQVRFGAEMEWRCWMPARGWTPWLSWRAVPSTAPPIR